MPINSFIIVLVWGALSGFLLLRILEGLLATIICLHGLLSSRWKRLVNRASPGQIRYTIILRMLLRVAFFGLLFFICYELGDNLVRREFRFVRQGPAGLLWAVTSGTSFLLLFRSTWRRLKMVWRMTHQFDFAEKRQRTFMLKK